MGFPCIFDVVKSTDKSVNEFWNDHNQVSFGYGHVRIVQLSTGYSKISSKWQLMDQCQATCEKFFVWKWGIHPPETKNH